jgi:hypothetical protein
MFDLDMCKRAIAVLQVLGPELARAARPEARRA